MDHGFQPIDLDSLVKSAFLRDVLDDLKGELVGGCVGVCGLDLVGLGLRADGSDDGVAVLEEDIKNVSGDEAGATCVVLNLYGFGEACW